MAIPITVTDHKNPASKSSLLVFNVRIGTSLGNYDDDRSNHWHALRTHLQSGLAPRMG